MFIVNLIMSLWEAFADWRRRERAYAELMALDDHSLADIGLHRSEIASLVEGYRIPNAPSAPVAFPKPEKLGRPKEA